MRLSTARERDEERAVAVMHAALDAGASVLDTADAYALDEEERGHNERLVARALASWSGDPTKITVATKGGMTRPGGKWVADGRARSLTSACEASLEALGRIDLYQLHAPDPRTSFETSVRALARLAERGLVQAIGLCNVNVAQIDKARSIVPIAAVQVALSWRDDGALRSGVVRHCATLGIELLAHSPLGGWRRRGRVHPVLESIGHTHGVAPEVVALAWLLTLGVTPLVGATRVATAEQLALARSLELDERARAQLDEAFPAANLARPGRVTTPKSDAEVVLISGIAGAGKSRLAERYVERGYKRLNRDEHGGKLTQLLPALEQGLMHGERRWVLDNTYVTRAQRQPVIEAASRHGATVRCIWLEAPLAEAQVNAARRLIRRYGELPTPERLRVLQKRDPQAFDPRALFRMQRTMEPPAEDEGFASIERVAFEREPEAGFDSQAVFVQLEGVLRESRKGDRAPLTVDDLAVRSACTPVLQRWRDEGYLLVGLSWQPALAEGLISEEDVRACFGATRSQLGVDIELAFCPHGDGPPRCWCRPPLPGLVLWHIERLRLDAARSLLVGRSAADRNLASALGMPFLDAETAFA